MALAAISGTVSTTVIGLIVLGMVVLAIRSVRKKKKNGGCGCGCSGCSAGCNTKNVDEIK